MRQSLANLAAGCAEAGTNLGRTLRTTISRPGWSSFADINAAYAEFFDVRSPASDHHRSGGAALGATVEIDAIVALRLIP